MRFVVRRYFLPRAWRYAGKSQIPRVRTARSKMPTLGTVAGCPSNSVSSVSTGSVMGSVSISAWQHIEPPSGASTRAALLARIEAPCSGAERGLHQARGVDPGVIRRDELLHARHLFQRN